MSLGKRKALIGVILALVILLTIIIFKDTISEPQTCIVVRKFYFNTELGNYEEAIQLISSDSKKGSEKSEMINTLKMGSEDMKSRGGISKLKLNEVFENVDSAMVHVIIVYNGTVDDIRNKYIIQKSDSIGLVKENGKWVIYLKPLYY